MSLARLIASRMVGKKSESAVAPARSQAHRGAPLPRALKVPERTDTLTLPLRQPRGPMTESKICSRTGCAKTLRSINTTGRCGSGCRSPEAPPSQRAAEVGGTPRRQLPTTPKVATVDALAKFRVVAEALGKDPDAELDR